MNENIRSTGNDWEIEHTDYQQESYAHEQGKRLVKLSDVPEGKKFTILGDAMNTVWENPFGIGGGLMEVMHVGHGGVRQLLSDTIVQLVEEPVPDAIVDTVVAEECVKEDIEEARKWAKEQLDSITLNHMEMTSDDVMEKVPADAAIQHEMRQTEVYTTLEQILVDIWKIETREITVQELAMKVQKVINSGAYIQIDGTK